MNRKNYKKRIKKIKSQKTGEMISIYNLIEARYMEQLETDATVIAYQKNVPLKKWEALDCFGDLDVQKYSPSDYTSDFLLEFSNSKKMLIEVVQKNDLGKPKTGMLLEISRRYWSCRGIEWGIVIDKGDEIDEVF